MCYSPFRFLLEGLPFEDNSFDFIISEQVFEHVKDQVAVSRELHRILRLGGSSIHVFPARYSLLEPHFHVPLEDFITHRWWYRLWAELGIRNEYQEGLSARETADRNAFYFVEALNYVPNSCYHTVWQQLGYYYKLIDQENFDTSESQLVRLLGQINRVVPVLGWLNRTFHTWRIWLRKRG